MIELETRFAQTIERLDVPDVDLSGAIVAQLTTQRLDERRTRSRGAPGWSRWALGLVAAAAIAVVAIAPAREAVASWLSLGATRIEDRVPPEATADTTGAAASTEAVGSSADALGDPVTPATAITIAPFPGLGSPDAVFDDPSRGRSYRWDTTPELAAIDGTTTGLVLSVRSAESVVSTKQLISEVDAEPVVVARPDGDMQGLWIDGPHRLLQDGSDLFMNSGPVLLWVEHGLELRIESNLALPAVMPLAESMIPTADLLPPD